MANWFKEYEEEPIVPKAQIPWVYTSDFKAQSKFIKESISSALGRIDTANDDELLNISQHCYNLRSWIRQMGVMGYESLGPAVDAFLHDNFGNANIIHVLQKSAFEKWLNGKTGQYKLGENYFCIYEDEVYYRNFQGDWYAVDAHEVFLITPMLEQVADQAVIGQLELMYEPTPYDKIYHEWQSVDYSGNVTDSLLSVERDICTPEDILNMSRLKIQTIVDKPIAYKHIVSASPGGAGYIEYMIKISYPMTQFVQKRREIAEHTVYLLRDCTMFYELQVAMDVITGKQTSFDQLLIGRKLLSNAKREGGHWFFTQNVLYLAYQKHPHNFEALYDEYSRILRDYVAYSDEFAQHLKDLAEYIDLHIQNALSDNLTITIVDLGFQGSINILVKFIIDNYCLQNSSINTDIHMYVLAEWFKDVYRGKYTSETYSLLTALETLSRNEYMYEYLDESFNKGKLSVKMGSAASQQQANIELIVATMTARIANKLGLV